MASLTLTLITSPTVSSRRRVPPSPLLHIRAPAPARPVPARASPRPAPPPARLAPPSALTAPAPALAAPCPSLRSSLRSWLRSSLRSFLPNSAGCRLSGVRAPLAQHRLDARDVAPDLPELVRLRRLPGGPLHAQRELLLAQLDELIGELGRGLGAQLLGFHLANLPFHERGGHRELGAGEPERFAGGGLVNPFHLEQHLAGLYARHVVLDVSLARAHADLERFLRDRDVGKHADPDLPAALHVAGHGAARRFDLARRHARAARRLQAELAEGHVVAALRQAGITALELLAELGALGLKHRQACAGVSGAAGAAGAAAAAAASGAAGSAAGGAAPSASAACCRASSRLSNTSPLNIQTLTPMTPE